MNILRFSSYFFPEQTSSSRLSSDSYKSYKQSGFVAHVYTPTPTRGISDEVRKKYSKIKYEELYDGCVKVHRFPMYREGKNPFLRAIRYVLVNIVQYVKGCHAKNIDVIYTGSTPPTQGILCGLVKKKLSSKYKKNVPLIYSLQDVFPDSMVHAGMTKEGSLIWKIGRKVEDYTYRHADKIIVIGEDIKSNIMAKGVPEEKIEVIPNWVDTDVIKPVSREENALFDELSLKRDGFYITYAGNLGAAQGVDTIIKTASLLKDMKDIQFIIFGDGVDRHKMETAEKELSNLKLFPLLPQSRISEVYSLGDLSLVACKSGIGKGAIPSKSLSIMATATPVLLSFDENSELWNLIKENNCGYLSPADDAVTLADQIKTAYNERQNILEKGAKARFLAESQFSKNVLLKKNHDLVKNAVRKANNISE